MTGVLSSQTFWILNVVFIAAAGEETSCPKGGQIHLANQKCYWLSKVTSSWLEGQELCRGIQGGELASANSLELQTFIFYSFPTYSHCYDLLMATAGNPSVFECGWIVSCIRKTFHNGPSILRGSIVWIWIKGVKGLEGENPDHAGSLKPVPTWKSTEKITPMFCTQLALGTQGELREAHCGGRHLFLCEKKVTEPSLPTDSFLNGLVVMTGVYAQTQINPLPSAPDIGQQKAEMQLFPGMWFSHAGQLVSVELVVLPTQRSSLARVQILRPYCNPNHYLVPPGCSSLLNPFSCCSTVPLCNTTGGCSRGWYWCHLLEACVCTTCPCSPFDSAAGRRGFALPPRYAALPPFYHLVADLPLSIDPSSDHKILKLFLSGQGITVYPDDIVAIQHTHDPGTFLHCLNSKASLNSPWRQSYMSLKGTEWGGWWERGLAPVPKEGQWVDGVVCDLRMLYEDSPRRGTELNNSGFTDSDTTTAPVGWPSSYGPNPDSRFGLRIIYPVPDENNQINAIINAPTLIVVKVQSGENAWCSWSFPIQQTGIPFRPYCPEEVTHLIPDCKRQTHQAWFSAVTLIMPSEAVQMLNISVMDAVGSQSLNVQVCGYKEVTGLSVEPHGCRRMLVDTPQLFRAQVDSGSSVKFTWVIDNLDKPAHEGESYSIVFMKPAKHKLQVTASNPVSSQSLEILLTADHVSPMTEPEFLSVSEVVAVGTPYLYHVIVKADISLPLTFRWDFGDGSGKVIHTQSPPCLNSQNLLEGQDKETIFQDSVNYTYSISDDFTLQVQVYNKYDSVDASLKITVCPKLIHLHISSSPAVSAVNQTLFLVASLEPLSCAVLFTWDFGDGSDTFHGSNHTVSHAFVSAGVYNITVHANNTITVQTNFLKVEVVEKISGLTVSTNGSSELGFSTHLRAAVATGTSLVWEFDFGDGNLQGNLSDGSIYHIYESPGNYTAHVIVSNSVSQAHQSICITVFKLAVSGVLPTDCVMSGQNIQLTALVNGNISALTFLWQVGDQSPPIVERGQSTTKHRFQSEGFFHVGLTVFSYHTSLSFNTSICVELGIITTAVRPSLSVVAVGEEVCFQVTVSPEQKGGYIFKWFRSPSNITAMTMTSRTCFTFLEEGAEEVLVTAYNRVSNKTAKASVEVQNPVCNLSLAHDSHSDTLSLSRSALFWVVSCSGSNVSVLWDFGDGSPEEQGQTVSHVFNKEGKFSVTATAFNTISRQSVTLKINVLLPLSDLSLHTDQPYVAVGEETSISAVSSTMTCNFYWTVDGVTTAKQGDNQFQFTFGNPGIYQVRVTAQNLVSEREATVLIEVFERIEGPQIRFQNLTSIKYVPTQEELQFMSSVTKGSNVTYYWLATQDGKNRQVASGDEFQMVTEVPGNFLLQLRASNKLGEVTTNISLIAVQRVIMRNDTKQTKTVALGKMVNISVPVIAGTHLQYLWHVMPDILPIRTSVPFLLHSFTSASNYLVKVSVQNELSSCNITFEFNVQEVVQEVDFDIEGKKQPFYIKTDAAVHLHGLTQEGSDLSWNWKVNGTSTVLSSAFNRTFIVTFPHAGIYQVSLNVSNRINWQQVSHSVTVLDVVKGLVLNSSSSSVCSDEQVTFAPKVSDGSSVNFVLTIQNQNWTHRQEIFEKQFTTLSLPVGTNQVKVTAWNQVSSAEVSSSILVSEQIHGLQLVNSCSAGIEALKGVKFKAEVQNRPPVIYNWVFQLDRSAPLLLNGQEVVFTPQESGSLSFSVCATCRACSKTLTNTCTVHQPLKQVNIVYDSERIFVGYAIRFSAIVSETRNLSFLWNFGDASETLRTDENTISHTFHNTGKYTVIVNVLNSVSFVSTQLQIEVEKLQCSSPQLTLVQPQSSIFRSRLNFFEARVHNNCSAYKTKYQWEILKVLHCNNTNSEFPSKKITLKSEEDMSSPFLFIPKHSLDVGQYCLVFTVLLQGTPLMSRQCISLKVVHSPLVAVIKGGSHRLWPNSIDLVLDGSGSQDPDAEPGEGDALMYHWTIMTESDSNFQPLEQSVIRSDGSRMTVPSTHLKSGTTYILTLTVHKAGRTQVQVNQTVTVCEANGLQVTVECETCSVLFSPHRINYNIPIALAGKCEQCDDNAEYTWRAEDHTGKKLDLNEVTTLTGGQSANLVIRSDVLQPRQSYTFSLDVSQSGRQERGRATFKIHPINPPYGGLCDLRADSGIHRLDALVTYNCSGWRDDECDSSQLIYTVRVALCQPTGPECPLLTLYRGTRQTHGILVPVGNPLQVRGRPAITVTVLVENNLGAKVTALNRFLPVDLSVSNKVTRRWQRKYQTELWALVQHGNPQEIISYSIALISHINKMESGQNARELMDREQILKNVTQALASLPISSIMDVEQISSALSLSSAVSSEIVRHDCQEQVLKAVQKMVRVMQEGMSPGLMSVSETGRNILNIIGTTLAAVSFSSPQTYSATLQQTSTIFLSALDHTANLMRSLTHAQVRSETPLSLFSPHLKSAAFHGDPSNLLCSHISNQNPMISHQSRENPKSFCYHFHIPSSFTSHLKNQESEVVQVLYGLDANSGSNSFLTAADPPISTTLVAMELTTPQGEVITIQDLDSEQAIWLTLPNKQPLEQNTLDGAERAGDSGNGTCLSVLLPTQGELQFTLNTVDGLDRNSGLYISFNFTHDAGFTPVDLGHVKIAVSSSVAGRSPSLGLLERELALTSTSATSKQETIFLTPLFNRDEKPLFVNLTSSLVSGPVHASVCVFSALCQYFNVEERRWSSEGLQPLESSTLHEAHCLTKHLTLFGASMFIHPGAVVLLPPSRGPMHNLLVGIVCSVLVLIHVLMGLISYKMDHFNNLRTKQIPLCGRPGLYHYRVLIKTGWRRGAGTTAHVGICLYGLTKSGSRHLMKEGAFQRGSLDQFHLETDDNLGEIWKIRIWHDNTGLDPSWYVQHVVVWDPQTDHMFFFLLEDWLSVKNQKNSTVEMEVLATCPEELSLFPRVFSSQLMFGMFEHHLWLSLWECPAHSRFTRCQRVACSALLLHLYLALAVLWYRAVGTEGNSEPVSAKLLVNTETIAVGMSIAVFVFPVQCCLSFLFRKCHSQQVAEDVSAPSPPVCYSVEMDVNYGQLPLSGPSFLSFADTSGQVQDSPESLLESKVFDSSILDFWSSSGLLPQTVNKVCNEEGTETWPSCNSLPSLPVDPYPGKTSPTLNLAMVSSATCGTHQLRRKKALKQLCRSASSITDHTSVSGSTVCLSALSNGILNVDPSPATPDQRGATLTLNLPSLFTLSEEDLLMAIVAASERTAAVSKTNSDSGRDSPRTTSSLSNTYHSISCSSWSEQSEDVHDELKTQSSSFPYGAGLYKHPSLLSVDSMASTFLPSPCTESSRACSATRLGVPRAEPSWLFPPWTLNVIYAVVAIILGACLTVVGVYGSYMSRSVILMWLVSVLSAFFNSALLLEPFKVCMHALISTALWRPVDPEVEDQLAQELIVVRTFTEHGGKVRPPCGYSLLRAKEEASKIQALQSLMKHCVCQLLFLLLVLMVNYQDSVETKQGRLLLSAVRRQLHTSPQGVPNISSLRDWSDADQWINHTLLPHLGQSSSLRLVGLPQLQYRYNLSPLETYFLGNSSVTTQQLTTDLHISTQSKKQLKGLLIDFTYSHRDSALLVFVSIQLDSAYMHRLSPTLFIQSILVPASNCALDLQTALMVLLLISGLLILFGQLWKMATERSWYLHQSVFQLILVMFSLTTAILHFCFLSQATSTVSKFRSQTDTFINFHWAALLAQKCSQCAAVLLTLLVLKLLGTLKIVRRWLVLGKVLQRTWRELLALTLLLLLPLLLCIHLGNSLFSQSVEDFSTVPKAATSVLSIMQGRISPQRPSRLHPVLGLLYGLLLLVGNVWLFGRLCGAVLIHACRAVQADLQRPNPEPQDYEMVEFFIKRLKLWMGLTKAKEFRHRVKFEGMDMSPSRSSGESCLSTASPNLSCPSSPSMCSSCSPHGPLSSALSERSEDSAISESGTDIQPHLDRLLPCLTSLLTHFDQVSQITEEIYQLELKLEEAQTRRLIRYECKGFEKLRESAKPSKVEGGEPERHRKTAFKYSRSIVSLPSLNSFTPSKVRNISASTCIFPGTGKTFFESEAAPHQPQAMSNRHSTEAAKDPSGKHALPNAVFPGFGKFLRRRAWHSGGSHSADAVQRIVMTQGGAPSCSNGRENLALTNSRPRSDQGLREHINNGVPVKKKAWTSEPPETEQD